MKKEDKENNASKGFTVRDQRWWLREGGLEENPTDEPGHPDGRRPTIVEELEGRVAEKDRLLREYIQAHKSSVADMGDVRARMERDVERRVQLQLAQVLGPFLELLDNLQHFRESCREGVSIDSMRQGVELLSKKLMDLLGKQGVTRIPTQGARFDPNNMEALMTGEVTQDLDGMVLEEMRPGFALGNLVVRPAGVRVGVAKQG